MKNIKKLKDFVVEQNDFNEKISFNEAFEKFIVGQKVKGFYSVAPFGNKEIPTNERYYGDGMEFENDYKYLSYGGGCSGEDCNTTYIVDNNDKLVAFENW